MLKENDLTYEEFRKRFQYNPSKNFIGNGGNCDVFRAYDNELHRRVAIKTSKVNIADESRSLKRETELVKKLPQHDNVAYYENCYRFAIGDSEFDYAILEFYEHGNLLKFNKQTRLDISQKLHILKEILDGIHFLHRHKIIHRDLKPENVLIFHDDNEDRYIPKITDFEASKDIEAGNPSIKIATPFYSSPEQLKEGQNTDYNSDLWSFGLVALVFLDILSPSDMDALQQINKGILPAIDSLPEAWQNLIKACLKEEPKERIKSCEDCLKIIDGYVFEGNEPENLTQQIKKKRKWVRLFTNKQGRITHVIIWVIIGLLLGLVVKDINSPFTVTIQIVDWKGRKITNEIYESNSTIGILGKEPQPITNKKVRFDDIPANAKEAKVYFVPSENYRSLELVQDTISLKKGEEIELQIKIKGLEKISGKVINNKTKLPVDSAEIRIEGIDTVYTNKMGDYNFPIPLDKQEISQTIIVAKKGFHNCSKTRYLMGNTNPINFELDYE